MLFRSARFTPYHRRQVKAPSAASLIEKLDVAGLRSIIKPVIEVEPRLVLTLLDEARETPFDGIPTANLREVANLLARKSHISSEVLRAASEGPERPTRSRQRRPSTTFETELQDVYNTVVSCGRDKLSFTPVSVLSAHAAGSSCIS